MSEGYAKARAVADGLKEAEEEVTVPAEKIAANEEAKAAVLKQLDIIAHDEKLAKMYNDSAQDGAENLGGSLPQLKVHTQGRSTSNLLADGVSEPKDGNFFYTPTQQEFETIDCHILTISRGFRAPGLATKDGTAPKMVFNQILAGVIVNEGSLLPFIMYMSGGKLSNMWEFGKEANKYTHAKPVGIPMFAMTVKLSTVKEKTDFGNAWRINFDIVKEGTEPKLVLDPEEFQFLKDHVAEMKERIEQIIATKTPVSDDGEVIDASSGASDDKPF